MKLKLYDVQKKLISDAKKTIDNGDIGIFSSPTGTGKTLSLLLSIVNDLSNDFLELEEVRTRVFYCSRTHHQLSQAINEFRKLQDHHKSHGNFGMGYSQPYPSSYSAESKSFNSVLLGSRSIYCINDAVKHLPLESLNERCCELVKNQECPFYTDEVYLEGVQDIEDLLSFGAEQHLCPFYLSRYYSKKCELVFLPYNLLFTKEGRSSAKVEVRDCIIIVDEAHNICDSILNMNTVQINYGLVAKYLEVLDKYLSRCMKSSKVVKDIRDILQRIAKFGRNYKIRAHSTSDEVSNRDSKACKVEIQESVISVSAFLIQTELMDYNMLEIEEYVYTSNLAAKLERYNKNLKMQLHAITKFLRLLVMSDKNARIFYTARYFRFVPLDPKIYFDDIISAKSILFAGGTMEPVERLVNVFDRKTVYFSYDVVCTNFLSVIMPTGPSKQEILLTYDNRKQKLDEIVHSLVSLCHTVKRGGMVCFVPSKLFLMDLKDVESKSKFPVPVLYENESTFSEYVMKIKRSPVVLFAIMGGKLSEGVNFSDDLCRMLVIIGIPYPNETMELNEKIKFYGREHLTHVAMQTVNQTLGRALRHKNDYSCMILMDVRYVGLTKYLSSWIKRKTVVSSFIKTLVSVTDFLKPFYKD